LVSDVVAGLAVAVSIGAMLEDVRVRPHVWSVTDEDARNNPEVNSGDELPVLRWQGLSDLAVYSTSPGEALGLFGGELELERLRFSNPLEAIIAAAVGGAATAAAGALGYLKFLNTRAADRRKAYAEAQIAEQQVMRAAERDDLEVDVLRAETELVRAQAEKTRAEAAQVRIAVLRELGEFVAAHRPGEDWAAVLPLVLNDEQAVHLDALRGRLTEVHELPPRRG
jgi:hypothetical protein